MTKQRGPGFDYRAIADFRFEIRRFLHTSERIAREARPRAAAASGPAGHQGIAGASSGDGGRSGRAVAGPAPQRGGIGESFGGQGPAAARARRGRPPQRAATLTRRGEKLLKQLALAHRAELKTARSKLLQALTRLVGRDVPSRQKPDVAPPAHSRRNRRQATHKRSR